MADSTLALDVLKADGKKAGSVELPADIFDVKTNIPLIHQVVVAQRAAARQGTHSTKRRGEVSGAGRKPFKQKGTGNARQGSIRAPHMTGGGIVHGPKPRDYGQRTPKKMIAAALLGALSDRARGQRLHIVDSFGIEGTPSTKAAAAVLTGLAAQNKEKLDWRRSIVDLMKLLKLDSSLAARKELAKELHYTGDTNDSASMNIWLHKQVMQKLAENGGKVPDDLKS